MKKRFFALMLAVIMLLGMAVTPAFAVSEGLENFKKVNTYSEQFADVASDAWYHDVVAAAYEYGLMKGSANDAFNPGGNVTIIEAIILADRLFDIYYGGKGVFEQSGSPWYQVYVDYALEQGLIQEGQYENYAATASRKDFASILYMALPDPALNTINRVKAIPDVKQTESYARAVYFLYNAGILTGSDAEGSFKPESNITRAEVAAIVVRMADTSQRKTLTLGTDMTAMEFLTNLAKSMGEKKKNEDGSYYYSVQASQRIGLFNDNGDPYLTYLYVDSESDGALSIIIMDYHPRTTKEHPIYYYTVITINEAQKSPYFGFLTFTDGDEQNLGGFDVNPATLTENSSLHFKSYDGDQNRKAELETTYTEGVCAALELLEEDYLAPYGYTLKDLGFTAMAD